MGFVVGSEHRPTVTLRDPTLMLRDRETGDGSEGEPVPENIGRFIIQGVLGAGGMGTVLEAYDEALERRIAIKVMHPTPGGDDRRHALRREARALGGVSHPNVVEIFEVGEYEERLFIAMELVEGSTLVQWLAAEERSFEEIRDMLCDAGRGLQAAHARGLLHRDFKPENVLVGSDGRPRVVDFGLVSRLPDADDLTMTPVSLGPMTLGSKQAGTVPFMAPEQLMGWPLDARADQFAFCVTLYESVYGMHPFDAPGLMEIGLRIIAGEMEEPPARSDVPRWFPALLARGMASRPKDRFANMGALLDALKPSGRSRRSSWWVAVPAGVLMTFGVASSWVAPDGADACGDSEQLVADAWGSDHHEQVERVLLSSGVAYSESTWVRVRDRLDLYAAQWRRADREVCESGRGGKLDESVLATRRQCLDGGLRHLQRLVGALARSEGQVVERAVAVVSRLPGVDDCFDSSSASTQTGAGLLSYEQHARVAALRARLADVKLEGELGHSARASELLEGIVQDARLVDHPPLSAEVSFAVGSVNPFEDLERSEEALSDAFWLAQSNGQAGLAVDAGTALVHLVGDLQLRFEDGMAWVRHTQALIEREAMGGRRHAWLLNNHGNLLFRQSRFEEAATLISAALEFEGLEDRDRASFLTNLGNIYYAAGDIAQAEPRYLQALSLRERSLGRFHPRLASTLLNLGHLYLTEERYGDARPLLERVLALEEQSGPRPRLLGSALALLGVVVAKLGDLSLAFEYLERAEVLHLEVFGPNHPSVAGLYQLLADVHVEAEHWGEAERSYLQAREILERTMGSEYPDIAEIDLGLRRVRAVRGSGSSNE